MYSDKSIISDTVYEYLRSLSKNVDHIIVIADNPIVLTEFYKIQKFVSYARFYRHGMYDFGSYKYGFNLILDRYDIKNIDYLMLCNDTCYAGIQPFDYIINEFKTGKFDLYGISTNYEFRQHVQSYFWILSNKCIKNSSIQKFFMTIEPQTNKIDIIQRYEVQFTKLVLAQKLIVGSLIDLQKSNDLPDNIKPTYNPTICPCYMLNHKSPVIKKECILKKQSIDKTDDIYSTIYKFNNNLGQIILRENNL